MLRTIFGSSLLNTLDRQRNYLNQYLASNEDKSSLSLVIILLEKEVMKLQEFYDARNVYGKTPTEIEQIEQQRQDAINPFLKAIRILKEASK